MNASTFWQVSNFIDIDGTGNVQKTQQGDIDVVRGVQVSAACDITAVDVSAGPCNDNGTPANGADDFYLADVTVSFSEAPAAGNLVLSGDASASVAVGSLDSATSHTFSGIVLPADGLAKSITATFSADAACTLTNPAIAGVASCSVPSGGCDVLEGQPLEFVIASPGNTDPAYTNVYILTDASGSIVAIDSDGADGVSFPAQAAGIYTAYGVNYLAASGITGLTVGGNVSAIAGDCFEVSPGVACEVCESPCMIAAAVSNILRSDNGTPFAGDDTFSFDVTVTGSGTSPSGWTSDSTPSSGSYGVATSFGPFPVSGGQVTINFADAADPACVAPAQADPPALACDIAAAVGNVTRSDNGTPYVSDDTFSFEVTVTGTGVSGGWLSDRTPASGSYGVATSFGPFPVSGGPVVVNFTDAGDPSCVAQAQGNPPPPVCAIDVAINDVVRQDNGTPATTGDDTFTFTMTVTGTDVSIGGWTANDPNGASGSYGVPVAMGPYPANASPLIFTVSDSGDPACQQVVQVNPPGPACYITDIEDFNYVRNENGTPADPTDDTFTFQIRVDGVGTSAVGWVADDPNASSGSYGVPVLMGPYPADATLNFTIRDAVDSTCFFPVFIRPPAPLRVFDLALRKTLHPSQIELVRRGEDVRFQIEVINQGDLAAANIELVDYVPAGFSLSPNELQWAASGPGGAVVVTLPGALAPNASTFVDLLLRVEPAAAFDTDHFNYAEIAAATDEFGGPAVDVDSTPDYLNNEPSIGYLVDDEVNEVPPVDEDDHDVAQPLIIAAEDLAFRKTLAPEQSMPVMRGSLVRFEFEVFNQGNAAVDEVELIEYIPAGLQIVDPQWVAANGTGVGPTTAATTITQMIQPGESARFYVDFVITPDAPLGQILNYGEITGALGEDGNPISDIDSTLDSDPGNDGPVTDNEINSFNGDEDDHDCAPVEVIEDIFDLALRKTLADGQSPAVNPGDLVTFQIEVFNQGAVAAADVEVTDYLQPGFTWPANAALNPGWIYNAGTNTAGVTLANPLAPITSARFNVVLQVDPSLDPNAVSELFNFAEISEDNAAPINPDADSTPDADDANDGALTDDAIDNENGDEDDHDVARVAVNPPQTYDLALRKRLSDGQGPAMPGDLVRFEIELFNQGALEAAAGVEVTDYLPAGLLWPANAALNPNWVYNAGGHTASITTTQPVAAGGSLAMAVVLQVDPSLDNAAVMQLTNYAEISADTAPALNPDADSTPDSDPANDGPVTDDAINGEGGDQDDHDCAILPIDPPDRFDLALRKRLAGAQSASVNPGDLVSFEIEVFNQGALPATGVQVTDYLQPGFAWPAAPALNPNWTYNAGANTAVVTLGGTLDPGESAAVTVTLQVDPGLDRNAVAHLDNFAEISEDNAAANNPDVDSFPDTDNANDGALTDDAINNENADEDDHDIAGVDINPFDRFDLALRKQLAPGQSQSVNPGDYVQFAIEVFNQGSVAANDVVVTDYLQPGFVWPANAALNPDWAFNAGANTASVTLNGALAPGDSSTVAVMLQVDPSLDRNAVAHLDNFAEISEDNADAGNPDADSTPDATNGNDGALTDDAINNENSDEDDHDIAGVDINPFGRFDLALRKQLAPGQSQSVNPGDLVSFSIEVFNQGSEPTDGYTITDYLQPGFTWPANAALNPGWTYSGGSNTASAAVLGTLLPGQSAAATLVLQVDPSLDRNAVSHLDNFAEISADGDPTGNGDADSTPDTSNTNDGPITDDAINNENLDEDDHDIAGVDINPFGRFDLALRKQLAPGQSQSVNPGDLVSFTIEVFNQGSEPSSGYTVTDYVQPGFIWPANAALNPGWTFTAGSGTAALPVAGPLAPGESAVATLVLQVDPSLDRNAVAHLDNFAEISADGDPTGNGDADSTPDTDNGNDGPLTDDAINNENLDEDDHDIAGVDINPFGRFDLALRKTLADGQAQSVQPGDLVTFAIEVFNQGSEATAGYTVTDYLQPGFVWPANAALNPGWANAGATSSANGGALAPGQSHTLLVTLQVDPGLDRNAVDHLDNFAEISADGDPTGNGDYDSTPDTSNTNDGPLTNDAINNENGDEDDHDIAGVDITPFNRFDLALRKQLAEGQSPTVNPGDAVAFTIEVFNQGSEPAANVQVVDYVQAGWTFNALLNPNWTYNGGSSTATVTLAGTILPGQSASAVIYLTVDPSLDRNAVTHLDNFAEIAADNDPTGNGDADSTPDTDDANDGALTDDAINNENADEDDHDIAGVDINPFGRFDLALRKRLASSQSSSVNPGDFVSFEIEVFNQGSEPSSGYTVTDYLQPGFVWPASPAANVGWTYNAGANTASASVAGPLAPAQSHVLTLVLQVAPGLDINAVSSLDNFAEISADGDPTGNGDADSTPDTSNTNDGPITDDAIANENGDEDDHDVASIGVNPFPRFDLALRKTLASGQAQSVQPGDLVRFAIEVFNQGSVAATDVRVTDYLQPGFQWPASAALNPGWAYSAGTNTAAVTLAGTLAPGASSTVTVTLRVDPALDRNAVMRLDNFAEISADNHQTSNGGNPDADSTPDAINGNDGALTDDAINNENNDEDDHDIAGVDITPFGRFDLALRKQLAPGQSQSANPGDLVRFSIEVINQGAEPSSGYTVTDYLQPGFAWPASPALNPGWTYAAGANTASTNGPALNPGESDVIVVTLRVDPALDRNAVAHLDNFAEISADGDPTGNGDYDSDPDTDNSNDGPLTDDAVNNENGDQDDHDIAGVDINPFGRFDLALRKQLAEGQSSSVNPGDLVRFTVEIFNQGAEAAADVEVTDYLQPGFVWPADAALNPDWVYSAATNTASNVFGGTLAPSASATAVIVLQVDPSLDVNAVSHLANFAEISADNDPTGNGDADSNPDTTNGNDGVVTDDAINNENSDEDDHDIAGVDINPFGRFDLALRKRLAPGQAPSVQPGDLVLFEIEVFNQGAVAASDVEVTDYLQPGFVWPAPGSALPGWSYSAATNTAAGVIGGSIAPGESAVVYIALRVDPSLDRNAVASLDNYAEISDDSHETANGGNPDADSTPDADNGNDGALTDDAINNENGDEDDHDIASVDITPFGRFDLALRKRLAPSQSPAVAPGALVLFEIEVFNQGSVGASDVEVTDYLQPGFVWPAPGSATPGWTYNGGSNTASATLPGTIAAGGSAVAYVALQVDPALDRNAVAHLDNYAEISDDNHETANGGNPDWDSTDDSDPSNDGALTDDAINNENADEDDHDIAGVDILPFEQFDLALRKRLAPSQSASVNPGDLVLFEIEVFNQGSVAASDVEVTDYLQPGFVWPASAALNPGWAYTAGTNTAAAVVSGSIDPGQSAVIYVALQVDPALDRNAVAHLDNYAEISDDNHELTNGGNPDADSTPDADNGNDGALTDDAINNENADEDDHDIAGVDINPFPRFDLALRKRLAPSQSQSVNPGDLVLFEIEVFNQGSVAASNVEVTDYLQPGFVWPAGAAANAGWAYAAASNSASAVIGGTIEPSASAVIYVALQVDPSLDRNAVAHLENYAEISGDNHETANGGNPDADSTPDADNGNDGAVTDDAINSENGDEDDHDIAGVDVNPFPRFDLALRKQLREGANSSANPGDLVTFTIEVFNQGSVAASDVEVTDYLQPGFVWPADAALNPDWVYSAATNTASNVFGGTIAPSASATVEVTLQVDPALDRNAVAHLDNFAEISADNHETANGGNPDADSTPDATNGNDGALTDDAINNENADEDDHDIAGVDINPFDRFDLALRKTLAPGQSQSVNPGDLVSFQIEVINQGAVAASDVEVTDYLQPGFQWPADAALNPGWAYDAGANTAAATLSGTLASGASAYAYVTLQVEPSLDRVAVRQIRNLAEISDDNHEVTNGGNPDWDSADDSDPSNDGPVTDDAVNNENLDEDDHDIASVDINPFGRFDLALRKTLANGESPSVNPGDLVTFDLEVFNQGAVDASDVEVTDYLQPGFVWPANAAVLNPGWAYAAGANSTSAVIPGLIPAGSSAVVSLTLQVDPGLDRVAVRQIRNLAEISDDNHEETNGGNPDWDSTDDSDPSNDGAVTDDEINNGSGDEDDHDIAILDVNPFGRFDLALRKTLAPEQSQSVNPGDLVTFRLEVFNQGSVAASDVEVTDYLQPGFIWPAAAGINPGWAYNAAANTATATIVGPVEPGLSAAINVTLQVDPSLDRVAIRTLDNYAEISDDSHETANGGNPDWDSTDDSDPSNDGAVTDDAIGSENGDEDDHDVASVDINPFGRFDLALRKRLAANQSLSVNPGDLVFFEIEVFNQGAVAASDVEVTDYLQPGFVWPSPDAFTAGQSANGGWAYAAATNTASTVLSSAIDPGQSATVLVALQVDPSLDRNAVRHISNLAEISDDNHETTNGGNPDADSTDDGDPTNDGNINDDEINNGEGDEDDHDIAGVDINPFGRFDLALRKGLEPGQSPNVKAGDYVHFVIDVFNQGSEPATNVEVADYLPEGFVFPAGQNVGWTYSAAAREARTVFNGTIQPGDSVQGLLVLQVDPVLDTSVVTQLVNIAEIVNDNDPTGNGDADSTPDNDPANDGYVKDDEINNEDGDQDDHDIAIVRLDPPDFCDLALRKTLSSGQDYNVRPGEVVCFDLEVFNQGARAMSDIKVCDYLPGGLEFEQVANPDWTDEGVINGVHQVSCVIRGPLQPGETQVLRLCVRVTANHQGGILRNCAEICEMVASDGRPCFGDDSVADNIPNNDGQSTNNELFNDNFDEDDHDCEQVYVVPPGRFDLALRKTPAIGQSLSVNPGDRVNFTIEVFNQGDEPAKNILIVDYLPPQLEIDDYNWFPGAKPNTVVGMFNGTLLPGESTKVNIRLRVKEDPSVLGQPIRNYAEIMGAQELDGDPFIDADSAADDIIYNDGFLTDDEINGVNKDEDDHDIAILDVNPAGRFDLALRKRLAPGQKLCVNPGDKVTFTLEIFNQGAVDARNITVCDYIPDGLELDDQFWDLVGGSTAVCTITGPLPPGASATIDICLRVKADAQPGDLYNCAEICDADDNWGNPADDADSAADSDPDNDGQVADNEINSSYFDEDDHDCELVKINAPEAFDLALRKTLATGQPLAAKPGDTVWFNIEIFNQGGQSATDIKVCDYLPAGFALAPGQPDWHEIGNGKVCCVIRGPLQPNASSSIMIALVVQEGAAGTLTNCAEICGAVDESGQHVLEDLDSSFDEVSDNDGRVTDNAINNENFDQDDHDCATVAITAPDRFDLALRKRLATTQSASVSPGQTLIFTIEVFNQGDEPARNVTITDTFPADKLTLTDPTWIPGAGTAAYTIAGPIQPGEVRSVNIIFQVKSGVTGGLVNTAEISAAQNSLGQTQAGDDDSVFDADPTNDGFSIDDEIYGNNGDQDDHDTAAAGMASGASLGDFVWEDLNHNGIQDAGEPGISGVAVTLMDAGGPVATGTTDVSGRYGFTNLAPGTYQIRFTAPSGYTASPRNAGAADRDSDADPASGLTGVITLAAGETDITYDAGFYRPASIGDRIWNDANRNGIQDDGESGLAGATVTLLDASGTPVGTPVVTGADGAYVFTDLVPGTYSVRVTPPSGYVTVPPNQGPSDLEDSDIDPATLTAGPIALAAGQNIGSVDAGFDRLKLDRFADWQGDTAGAGATPNANNDGDFYDDLAEFAFCLKPDTGKPELAVDPQMHGGFCLELDANGEPCAVFTRPVGGLPEITYVLEGSAELENWVEITAAQVATNDLGNGVEEVWLCGLGGIAPLTFESGFVRLRVEYDGNGDDVADAVTWTEAFGWRETSVFSQCETYAAPFLGKDPFTGRIASASGSLITVDAASGILPGLDPSRKHYVEILDGAMEGHRFDVSLTSGTLLAIDTGSSRNTAAVAASLAGSRFTINAHKTLDELFDKDLFVGTNDPFSADRLLLFGGNSFGSIYLLDAGGYYQWTKASDLFLNDAGSTVLDPCEGIFVHPRNGPVSLFAYGRVRSNAFACPLEQGFNFVASGFPIDQSPADRKMLSADGFVGASEITQSDRFQLWAGDGVLGPQFYRGHYLIKAGPFDQWTPVGSLTLPNENDLLLFGGDRSAFYDVRTGRPAYRTPLPWTP